MTTIKKTGIDGEKGKSADDMKVCHPSVCVGDVKPSSCVCPLPAKK